VIDKAAPAAPQRSVARAWNSTFRGLRKEVRQWSRRLAQGQPPLRAGEIARLRSLMATLDSLMLSPDGVQISAWMMDKTYQASRSSLLVTLDAVPAWARRVSQDTLGSVGGLGRYQATAIERATMRATGRLTHDFAKLAPSIQDQLTRSLTTALTTGEGPREYAKRISAVVDSVPRSGQARSVMIARTTLARVYDETTAFLYAEAAAEGVLYGWRWRAESSACAICMALNGMVFQPMSDTHRHPNCRCTKEPILRGDPDAVPFGDRFDPFPDTASDFDRLELATNPGGWTTWRLRPEMASV
jgi:SPP1 gp7 family putative phage head morphogenesis protein